MFFTIQRFNYTFGQNITKQYIYNKCNLELNDEFFLIVFVIYCIIISNISFLSSDY